MQSPVNKATIFLVKVTVMSPPYVIETILPLSFAVYLQLDTADCLGEKKGKREKVRNERGNEKQFVCFSAFLSQACYRSSFPAGQEVNNMYTFTNT